MGGANSNRYFPGERQRRPEGGGQGLRNVMKGLSLRVHALAPHFLNAKSSKPFFLWPV